MSKKAILLAGGAGTRLYPLTKIVCKQLLPVYDKPMICYPLATLMLGGLREILVISTPKDVPMLRDFLGDGSHLGIRLEYAEQPEPKGIAQAFLIGADFVGDRRGGVDTRRQHFLRETRLFSQSARDREVAPAFSVIRCAIRSATAWSSSVRTDASSAWRKSRRSRKANTQFRAFTFTTSRWWNIAKSLRPSARGELEITDLNLIYLRQNSLHVRLLGRGMAWLDTGTQTSLLEAANYIATIEHRQGLKVACLEEVALRAGFIGLAQMGRLIDRVPKGEYRDYLRLVAEEDPMQAIGDSA